MKGLAAYMQLLSVQSTSRHLNITSVTYIRFYYPLAPQPRSRLEISVTTPISGDDGVPVVRCCNAVGSSLLQVFGYGIHSSRRIIPVKGFPGTRLGIWSL